MTKEKRREQRQTIEIWDSPSEKVVGDTPGRYSPAFAYENERIEWYRCESLEGGFAQSDEAATPGCGRRKRKEPTCCTNANPIRDNSTSRGNGAPFIMLVPRIVEKKNKLSTNQSSASS